EANARLILESAGWVINSILISFADLDKLDIHLARVGGKLDGIVNEIGDRLQKEIPIAAQVKPVTNVDPQVDILVFGDRLVDIADLAQHLVQWNLTESRRPPTVLDCGQAQQRRDDGQRQIDVRDRLV